MGKRLKDQESNGDKLLAASTESQPSLKEDAEVDMQNDSVNSQLDITSG